MVTPTDQGAPAPEIPEDFGGHIPREMIEQAAGALLNRGIDEDSMHEVAREVLEAAGVPALLAEAAKAEKLHQVLSWLLSPTRTKHLLDELESRDALLARVKELEDALAFYSDAQNYQPDRDATHWVVPVYQDLGHRAHAVLAKKDAP